MDAAGEPVVRSAPAPLAIGPTVAAAARIVGRHGGTYAALIVLYTIILELAIIVAGFLLPWLTAWLPAVAGLGLRRLVELVLIEFFLIACGTALFIIVQRAAVLGERPSIAAGLRIRRQDYAVWRAVLLYWLAAHLLPTLLSHLNGFAAAAGLDWYPRYAAQWDMPIYWAFVCSVAPWLALGLPIALFEGDRHPFRTARRRLRGQWPRYLALLAICLLPGAVCVGGREILEGTLALPWVLRHPYLNSTVFAGLEMAYSAETYFVILLMSAAIGAAYSRLSPAFEPVYRVFD
jgi:hypothetical protein